MSDVILFLLVSNTSINGGLYDEYPVTNERGLLAAGGFQLVAVTMMDRGVDEDWMNETTRDRSLAVLIWFRHV